MTMTAGAFCRPKIGSIFNNIIPHSIVEVGQLLIESWDLQDLYKPRTTSSVGFRSFPTALQDTVDDSEQPNDESPLFVECQTDIGDLEW
jgi:hypothetical protein